VSVDEAVGGGDEVVVVGVESLLEFLGLSRELLLGRGPSAIPSNVGRESRVLHVVDVAIDHVAKLGRGSECVKEVVSDLPIVEEVGPRVLATRLQGFLKNFPSLPVAPVDERAVLGHDVSDVPSGVDVPGVIFCHDDVVFVIVQVEDEPVFTRVVAVAVFFVRLFVVGELDGGVRCPFSL